MKRPEIPSAKLTVTFPRGKLPAIDPADPAFVLAPGGLEIRGKINPKAAGEAYGHPAPRMREPRAAGRSLAGIAEDLNADGHATRRGKPWDKTQVRRVLDRIRPA